MNSANRKNRQKPSVADRILEGMREIAAALEKGEDLSKRFRVTRFYYEVPDSTFDAKKVKRLRKRLQASPLVFARFLGVSPRTVEAWESGASTPNAVACRFMDEMERNPEYWVKRLQETLIREVS